MNNSDAVEVMEHPAGFIEIHQDTEPSCDPRDNDNLGTMLFYHRRYDLGDVKIRKAEYPNAEDAQALIQEDDIFTMPVYMYDHGGIGLSTNRNSYPFNCPWDSGQLGIMFITKEKIEKECVSRPGEDWRAAARRYLQSELEEYDQFCRGEVYGWVAKNKEEKVIDSCWGFIGFEYAKSAAWEEGGHALDMEAVARSDYERMG